MKEGQYTHVILSPEQALHKRFKAVVRDPVFQQGHCAFLAIDELHCVSEWREFRKDFANLRAIRSILPAAIPMFGCTATLDKDNQDFILNRAGFHMDNLLVHRETVDRPNISLIIQPLVKTFVTDLRRLDFLMEGINIHNFKDKLAKTIIYVKTHKDGLRIRYYFINLLLKVGFNKAVAKKVVRRYDSEIREADKEIILRDFMDKNGTCLMNIATSSLGMGLDVPQVRRVVVYGIPLGASAGDYWQKIGRAMRGFPLLLDNQLSQEQGEAYIFAPYWCFNHFQPLNKERIGRDNEPSLQGEPMLPHGVPVSRQQFLPQVGSRLRFAMTVQADDNLSMAGSETSQITQATMSSGAGDSPGQLDDQNIEQWKHSMWGNIKKLKFSQQDLKSREKLPASLLKIFNTELCYRHELLDFLQEPFDHCFIAVNPLICCNRCNPELGRVPTLSPRDKTQQKPRKGSVQDEALQKINTFCMEKAQQLLPQGNRRFRLIGEWHMPQTLQCSIARQFSRVRKTI